MSIDPVRRCGISEQPLSVDRLLDAVRDRRAGALVTFVGVVRDNDGGQPVNSLDYTAHPSALERLSVVIGGVCTRHDVIAIAVEHRIGHLEIGDLAVVIAVSSGHRAEAFEACRDAIDSLKAGVPIWKKQAFGSGEIEWVGLP